jgi:hypothetical protein
MPPVRVVIPTFNRASAVCDALASVRAQTFGDYDVVVVDDASSDDTVARVRDVAARDTRIRLVSQEHGGAAAARNMGIAAPGQYEYVAFLDADDLWSADHLQSAVEVLDEEPDVTMVFGPFETRDLTGTWSAQDLSIRRERMRRPVELSARTRHGDVHVLDPARTFTAYMCGRFFPGTPTVVVRASRVPEGRWFNPAMEILEDAELLLRLLATGRPWAFIDRPQAIVQFLGDNLTRSRDLSSPQTLARQRCALRFSIEKLAYCRTAPERDHMRKDIAENAYLVGQCCAEQGDWRGARAAYIQSVRASASRPAIESLLASYLPRAAVTGLKRILHPAGSSR